MSGPGTARDAGPPVVLAVSPHLDDAAFSAGALLAGLAARGAQVRVATVFTASVPGPEGFALACQTDKGFGPDVDYMALRRAEDEAAMAALGVRAVHLGLAEAPHRGYADAAALFGPVVAGDEGTPESVAAALAQELAGPGTPAPDLVLGPAGLGDHVDHRHVRDALELVSRRHGPPVVRWDDLPYALRLPSGAGGAHERPATAAETRAKLAACASYPSQLGFQFGDVTAMAAALRSRSERFSGDPERTVPARRPGPPVVHRAGAAGRPGGGTR
ncbi:PIG-L deacetylase family protein [Kocuria sp. M1N1S27]|uniref:PIG-L deacetylase family protein n=1 Tax=Kocuria kalidii TaxID=3376283 RepID=UPI003797C7D7